MALTAGAMVLFAVLAGWKGFWRTGTCIHYTLFSAAALAFVWIMYYWNLL